MVPNIREENEAQVKSLKREFSRGYISSPRFVDKIMTVEAYKIICCIDTLRFESMDTRNVS